MSKPIPRKKVVAKKNRKKRQDEIATLISPKAAKAAERRLDAYLVSLDEKADEREAYTTEILRANDDSVEEIVGWTVDILRRMEGEPKLVFEGQTLNAVKGNAELLKSIQTRNFRWIAVRMLVASALWDIQIGNFKLPQDKCARCAKPVKKPKPRRKVK